SSAASDVYKRQGMGVVFAAFDPQLNRKIALKILRAQQAEPDNKRQLRARLFREAQAIAKLSHPNVITVFDVGNVGASVFVGMEFVEGVTLTDYLAKPRSLESILDAFAQAGRGLSAAHQAGLVHRDFKPDNVLMGFDGIARVSDFGLARSDPSLVVEEGDSDDFDSHPPQEVDDADLLSSPMTQAGAVVGTPRYMAPEQHAGAPPDPRSDQFAFCVALYQALYRQDPYVAHSMERLVHAKQEGRISEPPQNVPIPGRIEQLIWRGLAPDPGRRYPTMEALLEDLRDVPVGPSRPVLRWVVGLALSSAALGAAALQSGGAARAPCDDGASRWEETWNPGRRDAVRAAFVGVDPEASAVSWPAVERGLDAYGDAFRQQYADACSSAKVPVPAEDMFFRLRQSCLMERRDFAASLVDLFEDPDGALVRAAPQAVAELPGMTRCTEISGLIARGIPSRVEEEVATTGFRRALMQSRVLGLAGQFEAALSRAAEALEQAERLGVGESVAEAHLVLGRALGQGGRYTDAEQHLRQAVLGGTRFAHDEAAAEAAIALVEVVGVRLDRHAEASLWEAQARALLDRIAEQGILRARLENHAGRLDARRGEHAAARAHYTAALSLRSLVQGTEDPGRAAWLIDLGNVALAEGEFDEAVESFDRALALAEATLTESHPARAASLAALGRVHLRREEYGPAREALLAAKSGLEGSLGARHPRTAMVLLGLANADEGLGNAVAAEAGYARAADVLGATLGREHVVYRRALLGQSRSARSSDQLEDAVGWLTRACGGPAVPASIRGACLLERAEFDFAAERFDDATSGFTNAAARFEAGALADPRRRAEALLGVARSQRALGRNDEAARALGSARTAVRKVKGYVPNVLAQMDRFSTRLDSVVASTLDESRTD
ncbi:MAG: serine/threonine-protein kinase, partial [Nannocystaceae bacterium]|nr:serine/threonine-protein kinase [Nannocystaceae bacterium]